MTTATTTATTATTATLVNNELAIRHLSFLVKSYDHLTRTITAEKNMLHAILPEMDPKHCNLLNGYIKGKREYQGLEQVKSRLSREIEKHLRLWPVYTEWLSRVPGVAGYIGGNMILHYYYKNIPVCATCHTELLRIPDKDNICSYCQKDIEILRKAKNPQPSSNSFELCEKCSNYVASNNGKGISVCTTCGADAKGKGLLTYKIAHRDFPKPSKWTKFCGLHCDDDGKRAKRKKGKQINWSPAMKQASFQFGQVVQRQPGKSKYNDALQELKATIAAKHPAATPGHINNMALHRIQKLFQSHFWQVARTIDNKPLTKPYVLEFCGHTGMIEPYYWNGLESVVF